MFGAYFTKFRNSYKDELTGSNDVFTVYQLKNLSALWFQDAREYELYASKL